MNNISVRRIEKTDEANLKEFYYLAYGERAKYKYPERWNWQFKENIFNKTDKIKVYIAENSQGNIIGHTASSIVPVKILNNSVIMGWGVDAIVSSEFRGLGIGKMLQKINQDEHEFFASLSMSDANKHIKIKLGASLGPSVNIYVKQLIFDRNFTSRLLKIIQKSKPYNYNSGLSIIGPKNACFNQDDTILWNKIRNNYVFAVERNAEYLNWRYKKQPWTEHNCFKAYDKNNELVGTIIYRKTTETKPNGVVILELIGERKHPFIFHILIEKILNHLIKENIYQVHIAVSDPVIDNIIQTKGFIKVGENTLIYKYKDKKISKNSISMLSKGDQDWDQYPLARNYSTYGIIRNLKKEYKFYHINDLFIAVTIKLYFIFVRIRAFLNKMKSKH
jgi:hypothetical protein